MFEAVTFELENSIGLQYSACTEGPSFTSDTTLNINSQQYLELGVSHF